MTTYKKWQKWLFRRLVLPILLVFFALHLLAAALLIWWKDHPINGSMFMLSHRLQGKSVTQQWVEYDKIAKVVKQAAIASEDAKFASHNGFDVASLKAAYAANASDKSPQRGGSTITQQLAKNLFLTSHRSYLRKGEEAILTLMIESLWDKERILSAYLNVAEFGDGIYGVEAAARHYFGKSAHALNADQAAFLIALLPNPKHYQQHPNAARLQNKKRVIKQRMPSAALP